MIIQSTPRGGRLSSWGDSLYHEIMTTRPYRKKKRARQEKETRRRITEAAVELHRTLGPAKAGVTDVAKAAGVSRMTVYNHFPTERDLFMACSGHWASRNPTPDPSAWAEIEDASARLVTALRDLYEWYLLKEDMLGKVMRDIAVVPALESVMEEQWSPWVERVVDTLAEGLCGDESDPEETVAALRLAVDFNTWQLLTASGLSNRRAAELGARMAIRGIRRGAARSVSAV